MPGIDIVNNGDEVENHVSVADVAELLLQQFVIISGSFIFRISNLFACPVSPFKKQFFKIRNKINLRFKNYFQVANQRNVAPSLLFPIMAYFIHCLMMIIND